MVQEKRKTKWAVLWNKKGDLKEGEEILIQEISPFGGHGGGGIEKVVKLITVVKAEEVAPNMTRVQTKLEDYYIYNYSFPQQNICFPVREGWHRFDSPEMPGIGERMTLARSCKANHFKEELTMTNPVIRIEVITSKHIIAWCKDKSIGDDIGYVINVNNADPAPKGNFYWLWSVGHEITKGEEGICNVTVEIAKELYTSDIKLLPKNATEIGNATLFEGEDGNFYITQYPITSCWKK